MDHLKNHSFRGPIPVQQPGQSNHNNRPIAPPVYRPLPAPRVLQGKLAMAQPRQPSMAVVQPKMASASSPQRPTAPPVYHPQQREIVQPKMALQSRKPPVAPPVFRPGAAGVQPKMASGNRQTPTAPPVYRPQQTNILQGKLAADPVSARMDNSVATDPANVRLTTPSVVGSNSTRSMTTKLGDRIRQMHLRGPQFAGTALQAMMGARASNVIQRSDSDNESEWMEETDDAPKGYIDPSDYYDEFGGSDHSDMDGIVWVKKVSGSPALWWRKPNEQVNDFKMQGTRSKDVIALGGDDKGFTWHHCADYSNGTCTMQQVPTDEHSSWGHIGAASQAGYNDPE